MIIRNRETQTENIRNQTVNGLAVLAYLINPTGTPVSSDVDFEQSVVKVILNRNGVQDIIVQDDFKKLGLASNVDMLTQYAFDSNGDTINSNLGSLIAFVIPFGGHINLKGDDFLFVEVSNMKDLFVPAITASSYLEVKPLKSVGYEEFIPSIKSVVVQASESSRKYDLGDNVKRAVILNYDKTNFTNNVIQNITISSDRYSENLTFGDLILGKVSRYGKQLIPAGSNYDLGASFQQDQSFVLMDFHQHFNGVEFDIKFNPNQVTQGNNVLVYWTYRTDMTILNKAANLQAKHQEKAVAAIPAKS
ncbi:hypothetical protein [Mucilaginibacter flavus]|uniref:hypothetical protein n=1 Tax=Mucilaginibacter flavus TaxID=931504 RepID=UPI0025B56448|nr:hypothetical protein [Mucilaginibacter flavus]MDN3584737.1 hypothetical protein [Mucilaginibacter flavus]